MSLDVSLYIKSEVPVEQGEKIFIREDGQNKEISREEWDKRFPGQKPITVYHETEDGEQEVFTANITHNLNKMANKAGIYETLWNPIENGACYAHELVDSLQNGLCQFLENPDYYKQFNPPNGWGTYEGLMSFVAKYLEACVQYPDAKISISK